MEFRDRDLQAPWIGYPKDYWDKDEEEYVDDCLGDDEEDNEEYEEIELD